MSMSKEKPLPPGDSECCESGCSRCVWDTYFEELDAWNEAQSNVNEVVKVESEPVEEVYKD